MALKYITSLKFARALGFAKDIPSWDVGNTPSNEAIGTGDGSNKAFYLDHQNIITDSYTLYANAVEMTETTHYSLENDTGKITLTDAGVIMLTTNDLTGKYSYISNGMKDSYMLEVLERAEGEVDSVLDITFTDGTLTNPDYPLANEEHPSKGLYDRDYFTKWRPLISVTSDLDGDITLSDTTISLASGEGMKFPSTGNIIIGSEIITYTGVSTDDLTGCSRGTLGSTAVAHLDGDTVNSTIVRVSDTSQGTTPSWTAQQHGIDVHVDSDGKIQRYKDADPDVLSAADVENRINVRYLYGYDYIPSDITRLTLILAKRQLVQDNISKSMIAGRNEFRPEMARADQEEMNRIISGWAVDAIGNT